MGFVIRMSPPVPPVAKSAEPFTDRRLAGESVPTPTLPLFNTTNRVSPTASESETRTLPTTSSFPPGAVVPMPKFPERAKANRLRSYTGRNPNR